MFITFPNTYTTGPQKWQIFCGGLSIKNYCWPPWLGDEENFPKRARKNQYLQEVGNVNFHHKRMFIKKLFRVTSQIILKFSNF